MRLVAPWGLEVSVRLESGSAPIAVTVVLSLLAASLATLAGPAAAQGSLDSPLGGPEFLATAKASADPVRLQLFVPWTQGSVDALQLAHAGFNSLYLTFDLADHAPPTAGLADLVKAVALCSTKLSCVPLEQVSCTSVNAAQYCVQAPALTNGQIAGDLSQTVGIKLGMPQNQQGLRIDLDLHAGTVPRLSAPLTVRAWNSAWNNLVPPVTPPSAEARYRIVPAEVASLRIDPALPTDTVAGDHFPGFTLTLLDVHGNVKTDHAGAIHVTTSDARGTTPAPAVMEPSEGGRREFAEGSLALRTLGPQTITFCDAGSSVCRTDAVLVRAASLVRLSVTNAAGCGADEAGLPMRVRAGEALTFHALGFDADGNCRGNEPVTWDLLGDDIGDLAPAPDAKSVVFTATTVGGARLQARAGPVASETGTVRVVAGDPAALARHGPVPTGVVAGDARSLAVLARDAHGNPVEGVAVAWASQGAATIAPPTSVTDVSGVATATARTSPTVGQDTFTASVPGLAGSPVSFLLTTVPGIGTVVRASTPTETTGIVTAPQRLCVTVHDANGNRIAAGSPVDWAVLGGGGRVGPDPALTDASGEACTWLRTGPAVGENRASAQRFAAGAPLVFTSRTAAAAPNRVVADPDLAPVGDTPAGGERAFRVRILDPYGNPIANVPVAWSTATPGAAVVEPQTVTDADGRARATLRAAPDVGENEILATSAGLADPTERFTFSTVAGALARIEATCFPATVAAGETRDCDAAGFDANGNPRALEAVHWEASDASGEPILMDADGRFVAPTDVARGPVTVRARSSGAASAGAPLVADETSVAVVPGALAELGARLAAGCAGAVAGAHTLTADDTWALHAVAFDAHGNCIGPTAVAWTVEGGIGTIPSAVATTAAFVARTTGTGLVRISSGPLTNATGTVTVTPGAVATLRIQDLASGGADVGAFALTADQTRTLHAIGLDADGNPASTAATVWSVAGGCGVVNPPTGASTVFDARQVTSGPGCRVHATLSVLSDDTGDITVSPGQRAAIAIRYAPNGQGGIVGASSLTTDQTLTVHASGSDADGNFVENVASATWSLTGDTTCGALYATTGPSVTLDPTRAGATCRIRASVTSPAQSTETGLLTITGGAPADVRILTASGAEATGETLTTDDVRTFQLVGWDRDHNPLGPLASATWSLSDPTLATVGATGGSTPFDPRKPGSVTLSGTANGLTDTVGPLVITVGAFAALKVRDAAGGAGAVVDALALASGATRTLHAAGYDADDNFVEDRSVAWTVENACGSVGASGASTTFTAGYLEPTGVCKVRADDGPIQARTGAITVTRPPVARLAIRDAAGGGGSEVGALTLGANDARTLYAAAYDGADPEHYLGDHPVAWTVGACGVLSAANGTSSVLTAKWVRSGCTVGIVWSAVTDATGLVTITPGPLADVAFTASPATTPADTPVDFVAIGRDANGNARADPVTYGLAPRTGGGAIDASTGRFTPDKVGTTQAEACVGAVCASTSILVTVGALDRVAFDAPPTTTTADQTPTFVAKAWDAHGNLRSDAIAYSALGSGAIHPASGVFTPDKVGTTTIRAAAGSKTADTPLQVTPGTLHHVSFTAASPTTARAGDTKALVAEARDHRDNPRTDPVTYRLVSGTAVVTTGGQFTAYKVGDDIVEASAGGVTAQAAVRVTLGDMHHVNWTVKPTTTAADTPVAFAAKAYDFGGNELPDPMTYLVVTGTGSFGAPPGTFTPDKVGVVRVRAEAMPAIANETDLQVTVGALDHVRFTVTHAQTPANAPKTFVAKAYDANLNERSDAPTYSVLSGGGAIHPTTGAFTPGNAGATTLQAAVGAKTDTTSILVTAGPLDHFRVTAPGGTAGAPLAGTVTVQAVDAGDNPILDFAGTVTFVPPGDDPGAVVPAPVVIGAGAGGSATVPANGFMMTKAGPARPIRVTSGATSGETTVAIAAAALAELRAAVVPDAVAGAPFALVVTAYDAFDNVRTQEAGAGTLTAPPGDPLSPTTASPFVAGVSTTQVTMTRADAGRTLTFSTGSESVETNAFRVWPGPAASLRVTAPAAASAGVGFPVTLLAKDAHGNDATEGPHVFQGARSVVLSGPSAAYDGTKPTATGTDTVAVDLGAPTSLTFAAGQASTTVTLYRREAPVLTATTGVISGASAPLAVAPGAFTQAGVLDGSRAGCDDPTASTFDDRACILRSESEGLEPPALVRSLAACGGACLQVYVAARFDDWDNLVPGRTSGAWLSVGTSTGGNPCQASAATIGCSYEATGEETVTLARTGLMPVTFTVRIDP